MIATFITSTEYEEDETWVSYHVGAMTYDSDNIDRHVTLLYRTTPPYIYEVQAND